MQKADQVDFMFREDGTEGLSLPTRWLLEQTSYILLESPDSTSTYLIGWINLTDEWWFEFEIDLRRTFPLSLKIVRRDEDFLVDAIQRSYQGWIVRYCPFSTLRVENQGTITLVSTEPED
jgi:hypothetical protein